MNWTVEASVILLLILANGFFSMSEIAVVSARKARLLQWAKEGRANARAALELAEHPNRFLSTVQLGITLVGILAGAYGGATLAGKLAVQVGRVPLLEPYRNGIALAVVVLAITYASIVLGELVPKRLALGHSERLACATAMPMRALSRLAAPAVALFGASTEGVLRLFGIRPSTEPPVTQAEIRILIDQGREAGVFHEVEQDMLEGVLRLRERTVSDVITPRADIVWLDLRDSPEVNRDKISKNHFARYPICKGSLDGVVGAANAKELLSRAMAGEPMDLKAAMRQPLFVPQSIPALAVLEKFKKSGNHMALVVDEYGGIKGLVTLNDILEAVVGDISPHGAEHEPKAVRREDGSWLLDGLLPISEMKELCGFQKLPGEEAGDYRTLAGFVLKQLGRIPKASDHFEWGGARFEVVDMDGRRVDKVLVEPRREAGGADGDKYPNG